MKSGTGRFIKRALILIGLIGATTLISHLKDKEFRADGMGSLTPKAAGDFVRSVGVTTHLTYPDYKSNAYFADVFNSVVKPKIRELGIHHVRQYPGETDSNFPPLVAKFNELSNPPAGYPKVRFNFETHIEPTVSSNPQNNCYMPKMKYIIFGTLSTCHNLGNYTAASSILTGSIENPNEPDHCASFICNYSPSSSNWYSYSIQQNPNWPDDVLQTAQAAYTKLTTDAQTAGFERLAPAFVWLPYHQNETYNNVNLKTYLEPLKNYVTHGNAHPYCGLGTVANCYAQQVSPVVNHYAPKPVIVTETGHSTGQYTEPQQAKYLLRILFEFFERGIPRIYIYELLDEPSAATNTERNFGLLNEDGREKPAFVWLKNALTLLKDDGSASLQPLPITIQGPAALRSTLLRKSDGSYWLSLQNDRSNTVETDSTINATLTFATPKNVSLFNLETTNPHSSINQTTSINVTVPDRIVLAKIAEPASSNNTNSNTSSNTQSNNSSNTTTITPNGATGGGQPPAGSPDAAATEPTPDESSSLGALGRKIGDEPAVAGVAAGIIVLLLVFSTIIVRARRSLDR